MLATRRGQTANDGHLSSLRVFLHKHVNVNWKLLLYSNNPQSKVQILLVPGSNLEVLRIFLFDNIFFFNLLLTFCTAISILAALNGEKKCLSLLLCYEIPSSVKVIYLTVFGNEPQR